MAPGTRPELPALARTASANYLLPRFPGPPLPLLLTQQVRPALWRERLALSLFLPALPAAHPGTERPRKRQGWAALEAPGAKNAEPIRGHAASLNDDTVGSPLGCRTLFGGFLTGEAPSS